jgi:hypothetical protein
VKDAAWIEKELKEFVKTAKVNARENRKQAKQCALFEKDRAQFLDGGAEAMDYAAKEITRILAGKTSMEALIEIVQKANSQRKAKV